eukprot:1156622-Pelagomonas_calceolata.AAC.2
MLASSWKASGTALNPRRGGLVSSPGEQLLVLAHTSMSTRAHTHAHTHTHTHTHTRTHAHTHTRACSRLHARQKASIKHALFFLHVFAVAARLAASLRAMATSQQVSVAQDGSTQSSAFPTHKLSHSTHAKQPSRPVVLVGCGSYNPPTVMHMRMFELANDELLKVCAGIQAGAPACALPKLIGTF